MLIAKFTVATACAMLVLARASGVQARERRKPAFDPKTIPAGWVRIPAKGQTFTFGQQFEGKRWTYTFPAHPVTFTYDLIMSATQVTQDEYLKTTGANPTLHPGDLKRPIDNVSWYDAVVYCNTLSKRDGLDPVYSYKSVTGTAAAGITALEDFHYDLKKNGYRLMTSAEYEYVVRAGTTTTWFFGGDDADQDQAKDYAWCDRNAAGETHPVGLLKPNAYGVHDINGNLWMWCDDWYDEGPYPSDAQTDPTGPATGMQKIARGGAFKNDVYHERSAYHWQWRPSDHNYEVGFRIARTAPSVR
ncbi:MAG: Sulphatase-modifying factor protein [Capsulimonas sp.]|nr:Sulphatase-modifying factor protein [Capsulimonas sp.]